MNNEVEFKVLSNEEIDQYIAQAKAARSAALAGAFKSGLEATRSAFSKLFAAPMNLATK